jgi:tetratricopeptide (TPR) repeat protein
VKFRQRKLLGFASAVILGGFCTFALAHPFPEPELEQVNELLIRFPGDPSLYLQRARVQVTMEHFDQALEDLDEAEALGLVSEDLYVQRGYAYLQQGSEALAIESFNQALSLDPILLQALILRAQAHQQFGQPGLALLDWQQVIQLSPNLSPVLFMDAAQAADESEQYETALSILDQGLNLWPQESSLMQASVDVLWQMQQYDAAIQRLEVQAAADTPRPYHWNIQLAAKLLQVGREAEAKQALQRALAWMNGLPRLSRGQLDIRNELLQRMADLESQNP